MRSLPAVKRFAGEQGTVTVVVALFLPVFILLLSLLVLEGELFLVRAKLQNTADMAALAAVQELDMDSLLEGEIVIREEAIDVANLYGEMNLFTAFPAEVAREARVVTWVLNGSESEPVEHPLTGHLIKEARVLVQITLPWSVSYLIDKADILMQTTAEASVRTR